MQGIHRPKKLPRCPICGNKNTVGKVLSVRDTGTAITAHFCSNCLTEWNYKGTIAKPLYA